MRNKLLAVLVVGILGAPVGVQALPIAAWEAGGSVALCSGFTCGVQFTAVGNLSVTALGGFESALFSDLGIVGLWDSGGALLASVDISSADNLIDGYFYEDIAAQILAAGQTYTIGIWTGGSLGAGGDTPGTTNVSADLSLITGVFAPLDSGFQMPTITDSRFFGGANFLYNVVPEPGPLGLLGLGFVLLAFVRRRRST